MQSAENSSRSFNFVMDSYAILAYLEGEPGVERVRDLLASAQGGRCNLYMCVVNMGEVIYVIERERGLPGAQAILALVDELPIDIVNVDRTLTLAAAHLKSKCPIAYADCFAAGLSQLKHATLVTGDPEFAKIGPEYAVRIEWLPK